MRSAPALDAPVPSLPANEWAPAKKGGRDPD
jgi:hypothetical protein